MIVMPPPAPEPIRFEVLMSQSWTLFKRNWIVAVPPVIALLVGLAGTAAVLGAIVANASAHGLFERHAPMPDATFFTPLLTSSLVYAVVMLAVSLWSYATMYGMADAAWANGTATFGDGFTAFRTRSGALIVAGIGVACLAFAAAILALPTLGLAPLALPLVTMYVAPTVVSGRCDGFTAIGESFRLVHRFFGASAIALLILLAISYGISTVATIPLFPLELAFLPRPGETMPHIPAVGFLVAAGLWFFLAMIVAQVYLGYFTLAIVGLYRSLRAQPDAGVGQPPGRGLTV